MRILEWDVENLPSIGQTWTLFKSNISHKSLKERQSIICISWKWYGEKKTYLTSIADDPERLEANVYDDYHVTKIFRDVLDTPEPFVMMGHNLKAFDIKKFNTACIKHSFSPVPERQVIDTLLVARKHFKFESNRLDYVCRALGIGGKMETGGEQLWNDIVQIKYPDVGKEPDRNVLTKALTKMGKYCKQDVRLLDPLYEKLMPFMDNHPNAGLYDNVIGCNKCGSTNFRFEEWRYTNKNKYKRYRCDKGHRFDPPARLKEYYDHAGNSIAV